MVYTISSRMRHEKLFLKSLKLLERKIGGIAKDLDVDFHSKKLKLYEHLELMVAQGVEGYALRDISAFSRSSNLIHISSS